MIYPSYPPGHWSVTIPHPHTTQQRQDTYLAPHFPVASRSRDPEANARCHDIILVMWCYPLRPGCLTGGSPASLMMKRSGFTMTPGSCKTSANRGTFGDAKPNVLSEMYLNAWVVSTQKAKKEFNNIKPRSKYGHKNPYKSRKAQNPVSSSGLSARHPGTAPRLQQIYAESRTPCAPLKSEARVTASPVRLRTSLGESHSCKPMASGFLQSP